MKVFYDPISNQNGSMILIALMLLAVVTVLGATSISDTVVENRIALNDQIQKMTFYNADSGLYSTPKLIRKAAKNGASVPESDIEIDYMTDNDGSDFYDQIMGFESYDDGMADIQYQLGQNEVTVDVERISVGHVAGGGVEFASGAEGLGAGGNGLVNYGLFSVGEGPRNSTTDVAAKYRYVINVSGGL